MLMIDGPTMVLIISILVFFASLFLYKLGMDIRTNRIRVKRKTRKDRIVATLHKRWVCHNTKEH